MTDFLFIFFAGMSIALGINYLVVGFLKKSDKKQLLFGLFAFVSGIYYLLTSINVFPWLVTLFFATTMFILFPWYLALEVNNVRKKILYLITGLGVCYYISVLLNYYFGWTDIRYIFSYSVYILTVIFCFDCLRNIRKTQKEILWPFIIITFYFILFTVEEIIYNSFGKQLPWRRLISFTYLDLFPVTIIGFKLTTLILDQFLKSTLQTEVGFYKENIENILNQAHRFILTLDMNGVIKFANPYFLEFYTTTLNNVLNKNIENYLHHDDKRQFLDTIFNPDLNKGEIVSKLNTSVGIVTATWSFVKIKENYTVENKNVIMLFGANISEQIKVENELRKAYVDLKNLKNKIESENIQLQVGFKQENKSKDLIGNSPDFNYVLNRIKHVANLDVPVLLEGETGVGKELVANAIHNKSNRKEKAFIKVNCAAIPFELIESELFGYEKGAFTGAERMKKGMFEIADGGTLFLDEIGELSKIVQPKLLRALQEGEIHRLGSEKSIKVDVRIITATNLSLEDEVKAGNFRSDLYYRINVFPITIPPLRKRKQDIKLLVDFFCNQFSEKYSKDIRQVSGSLMDDLMNYSWPGNVRQLRNIIERAVITSSESLLKLSNPLPIEAKLISTKYKESELINIGTLEEFEKQHILKVLKYCNWKISGKRGAAEILNLPPSTLRSKMKKLKIKL